MGDEAAFLAAIRAAPESRLTRHVYADWLEERGDPRHELVRVCEAMRTVPVWSDDYWAWKARRNELWTQFPIEWLEATGYDGSDYDPIFRDGVPDGVRERWRLIREFTERWHGVSVPDVGGRRDVVARKETRLGLTLPESVREYVAFAHDVGDQVPLAMRGDDDHPRFLGDFGKQLDGSPGEGLTFFAPVPISGEHMAVGIADDDLKIVDPPIYHFDEYLVVEKGPFSPTMTGWMLEQLSCVLGYNYSLEAYTKKPDDYLRGLAEYFPTRGAFGPNGFEAAGLIVQVIPQTENAYVLISARYPVLAAALPPCLFEDEPFVGYPRLSNGWLDRGMFSEMFSEDPSLGSGMGLTRQRWDEAQRQAAQRGWTSQWISVLRRAEAARLAASGEPRA